MEWIKDTLEFHTHGKGMIKINSQLDALIRKLGIQEDVLSISPACELLLMHQRRFPIRRRARTWKHSTSAWCLNASLV